MLVRYIYVDVFAAAHVFDYMGIRVIPSRPRETLLFGIIAIAPALWLPVHLRQPTDVAQLFLFYAVHVPTAVLMPIVSTAPTIDQFEYCTAITLALVALDVRRLLPRFAAPRVRIDQATFWAAITAFCVAAVVVFAASGYLSLSNLNFVQVYGQREELADRASEIGPAFFYMAAWIGGAVAPFCLVVGLHRRRSLLLVVGIALATLSFIASSNKSNYIAVPAVIAGFIGLRRSRGRYLAVVMGAAFFALGPAALAVDNLVGAGRIAPVVTFQVFHRIFTNNGFLSAIYLDLFRNGPFGYYADSVLRWLPGPRLRAPVPIIAGASFAEVQGVWANANLWADGFANLGYVGIGIAALLTTILFWLYDGIAKDRDPIIAAALLIIPATVLANTAVQVAFVSNGMFLVYILLYTWSGAEQRARPAIAAAAPQAVLPLDAFTTKDPG